MYNTTETCMSYGLQLIDKKSIKVQITCTHMSQMLLVFCGNITGGKIYKNYNNTE